LSKKKTSIITVQNIPVTIASFDVDDYICITDMAKAKGGDSRAADIIKNWIRNRSTLEFLGTWEMMYNPIPSSKWSNLTTLRCRPVCRHSF
jgi:hypothetical protein